MKPFSARILSNKKLTADHYVIAIGIPEGVRPKPGQFFNIRVADTYVPFLRRPFSVYRIGKGHIEILYKVVGKATGVLSTKKKGEGLDMLGPLGRGFCLSRIGTDRMPRAVLIGGGHGVAPLYALAEELLKNGFAQERLKSPSVRRTVIVYFKNEAGNNTVEVTLEQTSGNFLAWSGWRE